MGRTARRAAGTIEDYGDADQLSPKGTRTMTAPSAQELKIQNPRSRFASAVVTLAIMLAGCGGGERPDSALNSGSALPVATPSKDGHGHAHGGHGAGPHDGTLADWGGGKYHVEFTVDHDKQEATVYVLADDEKTPAPIKAADGKLVLSINDPKFQVDLVASPLEGEAEGTSSRFVGKHESLGIVREFSGTIIGEVEGTPYAGDFKEEPHRDHDHSK